MLEMLPDYGFGWDVRDGIRFGEYKTGRWGNGFIYEYEKVGEDVRGVVTKGELPVYYFDRFDPLVFVLVDKSVSAVYNSRSGALVVATVFIGSMMNWIERRRVFDLDQEWKERLRNWKLNGESWALSVSFVYDDPLIIWRKDKNNKEEVCLSEIFIDYKRPYWYPGTGVGVTLSWDKDENLQEVGLEIGEGKKLIVPVSNFLDMKALEDLQKVGRKKEVLDSIRRVFPGFGLGESVLD